MTYPTLEETPPLAHVTTTLQFCIEQMELCNKVLLEAREMDSQYAVFNALQFAKLGKFTLERGIRLKELEQKEMPLETEGAILA